MSDKVENENLYTTRASGELRQRLEAFIEDHPETKSGALRELLDLGEQTAGAEAEPAVLQERLDDVREERDKFEDERDALEDELDDMDEKLAIYKFISGMAAGGFLAFLALNGLFSSRFMAFVPSLVETIALFIPAAAVILGTWFWAWIHIKPRLSDLKETIKSAV